MGTDRPEVFMLVTKNYLFEGGKEKERKTLRK